MILRASVLGIVATCLMSGEAHAQVPDEFKSLGFGVGIGATFLPEDEVNKTEVSAGIVRISDEDSTKRDVWFETHYLFDKYTPESWDYASWGPFVALRVGGDNSTFGSLGAGVMISWKRTPKPSRVDATKQPAKYKLATESKAAYNIGIGYASRKISVLGDGVVAGQPLPTGEEGVRTKSKDVNSWMLMFSFTVF